MNSLNIMAIACIGYWVSSPANETYEEAKAMFRVTGKVKYKKLALASRTRAAVVFDRTLLGMEQKS